MEAWRVCGGLCIEGHLENLKRRGHHAGTYNLRGYLYEFDFRYNSGEVTDVEPAKLATQMSR